LAADFCQRGKPRHTPTTALQEAEEEPKVTVEGASPAKAIFVIATQNVTHQGSACHHLNIAWPFSAAHPTRPSKFILH